MPEIAISSDGRDSITGFRRRLAIGEANGAASIWIACHLFERDPITLSSLALAETKHMGVALMAMSPFTMHPVLAAMAAATLDELHPGRVTLCLGVGAPADLRAVGIEADKPLRVMREALEVARAMLGGDKVSFAGETFKIAGRRLGTGQRRVPLFLAASGPKMLELAGAAADGVLISAGTSLEYIKWSIETVARGAKGRAVRKHALTYASVDQHEGRAHDRLRRTLAILLRGNHHARNLELAGSLLDQVRLDHAVTAENWAEAEALIADDVVRRHALSGTPNQVREKLLAYHTAGLDEVIIAGVRDEGHLAEIIAAVRRTSLEEP